MAFDSDNLMYVTKSYENEVKNKVNALIDTNTTKQILDDINASLNDLLKEISDKLEDPMEATRDKIDVKAKEIQTFIDSQSIDKSSLVDNEIVSSISHPSSRANLDSRERSIYHNIDFINKKIELNGIDSVFTNNEYLEDTDKVHEFKIHLSNNEFIKVIDFGFTYKQEVKYEKEETVNINRNISGQFFILRSDTARSPEKFIVKALIKNADNTGANTDTRIIDVKASNYEDETVFNSGDGPEFDLFFKVVANDELDICIARIIPYRWIVRKEFTDNGIRESNRYISKINNIKNASKILYSRVLNKWFVINKDTTIMMYNNEEFYNGSLFETVQYTEDFYIKDIGGNCFIGNGSELVIGNSLESMRSIDGHWSNPVLLSSNEILIYNSDDGSVRFFDTNSTSIENIDTALFTKEEMVNVIDYKEINDFIVIIGTRLSGELIYQIKKPLASGIYKGSEFLSTKQTIDIGDELDFSMIQQKLSIDYIDETIYVNVQCIGNDDRYKSVILTLKDLKNTNTFDVKQLVFDHKFLQIYDNVSKEVKRNDILFNKIIKTNLMNFIMSNDNKLYSIDDNYLVKCIRFDDVYKTVTNTDDYGITTETKVFEGYTDENSLIRLDINSKDKYFSAKDTYLNNVLGVMETSNGIFIMDSKGIYRLHDDRMIEDLFSNEKQSFISGLDTLNHYDNHSYAVVENGDILLVDHTILESPDKNIHYKFENLYSVDKSKIEFNAELFVSLIDKTGSLYNGYTNSDDNIKYEKVDFANYNNDIHNSLFNIQGQNQSRENTVYRYRLTPNKYGFINYDGFDIDYSKKRISDINKTKRYLMKHNPENDNNSFEDYRQETLRMIKAEADRRPTKVTRAKRQYKINKDKIDKVIPQLMVSSETEYHDIRMSAVIWNGIYVYLDGIANYNALYFATNIGANSMDTNIINVIGLTTSTASDTKALFGINTKLVATKNYLFILNANSNGTHVSYRVSASDILNISLLTADRLKQNTLNVSSKIGNNDIIDLYKLDDEYNSYIITTSTGSFVYRCRPNGNSSTYTEPFSNADNLKRLAVKSLVDSGNSNVGGNINKIYIDKSDNSVYLFGGIANNNNFGFYKLPNSWTSTDNLIMENIHQDLFNVAINSCININGDLWLSVGIPNQSSHMYKYNISSKTLTKVATELENDIYKLYKFKDNYYGLGSASTIKFDKVTGIFKRHFNYKLADNVLNDNDYQIWMWDNRIKGSFSSLFTFDPDTDTRKEVYLNEKYLNIQMSSADLYPMNSVNGLFMQFVGKMTPNSSSNIQNRNRVKTLRFQNSYSRLENFDKLDEYAVMTNPQKIFTGGIRYQELIDGTVKTFYGTDNTTNERKQYILTSKNIIEGTNFDNFMVRYNSVLNTKLNNTDTVTDYIYYERIDSSGTPDPNTYYYKLNGGIPVRIYGLTSERTSIADLNPYTFIIKATGGRKIDLKDSETFTIIKPTESLLKSEIYYWVNNPEFGVTDVAPKQVTIPSEEEGQPGTTETVPNTTVSFDRNITYFVKHDVKMVYTLDKSQIQNSKFFDGTDKLYLNVTKVCTPKDDSDNITIPNTEIGVIYDVSLGNLTEFTASPFKNVTESSIGTIISASNNIVGTVVFNEIDNTTVEPVTDTNIVSQVGGNFILDEKDFLFEDSNKNIFISDRDRHNIYKFIRGKALNSADSVINTNLRFSEIITRNGLTYGIKEVPDTNTLSTLELYRYSETENTFIKIYDSGVEHQFKNGKFATVYNKDTESYDIYIVGEGDFSIYKITGSGVKPVFTEINNKNNGIVGIIQPDDDYEKFYIIRDIARYGQCEFLEINKNDRIKYISYNNSVNNIPKENQNKFIWLLDDKLLYRTPTNTNDLYIVNMNESNDKFFTAKKLTNMYDYNTTSSQFPPIMGNNAVKTNISTVFNPTNQLGGCNNNGIIVQMANTHIVTYSNFGRSYEKNGNTYSNFKWIKPIDNIVFACWSNNWLAASIDGGRRYINLHNGSSLGQYPCTIDRIGDRYFYFLDGHGSAPARIIRIDGLFDYNSTNINVNQGQVYQSTVNNETFVYQIFKIDNRYIIGSTTNNNGPDSSNFWLYTDNNGYTWTKVQGGPKYNRVPCAQYKNYIIIGNRNYNDNPNSLYVYDKNLKKVFTLSLSRSYKSLVVVPEKKQIVLAGGTNKTLQVININEDENTGAISLTNLCDLTLEYNIHAMYKYKNCLIGISDYVLVFNYIENNLTAKSEWRVTNTVSPAFEPDRDPFIWRNRYCFFSIDGKYVYTFDDRSRNFGYKNYSYIDNNSILPLSLNGGRDLMYQNSFADPNTLEPISSTGFTIYDQDNTVRGTNISFAHIFDTSFGIVGVTIGGDIYLNKYYESTNNHFIYIGHGESNAKLVEVFESDKYDADNTLYYIDDKNTMRYNLDGLEPIENTITRNGIITFVGKFDRGLVIASNNDRLYATTIRPFGFNVYNTKNKQFETIIPPSSIESGRVITGISETSIGIFVVTNTYPSNNSVKAVQSNVIQYKNKIFRIYKDELNNDSYGCIECEYRTTNPAGGNQSIYPVDYTQVVELENNKILLCRTGIFRHLNNNNVNTVANEQTKYCAPCWEYVSSIYNDNLLDRQNQYYFEVQYDVDIMSENDIYTGNYFGDGSYTIKHTKYGDYGIRDYHCLEYQHLNPSATPKIPYAGEKYTNTDPQILNLTGPDNVVRMNRVNPNFVRVYSDAPVTECKQNKKTFIQYRNPGLIESGATNRSIMKLIEYKDDLYIIKVFVGGSEDYLDQNRNIINFAGSLNYYPITTMAAVFKYNKYEKDFYPIGDIYNDASKFIDLGTIFQDENNQLAQTQTGYTGGSGNYNAQDTWFNNDILKDADIMVHNGVLFVSIAGRLYRYGSDYILDEVIEEKYNKDEKVLYEARLVFDDCTTTNDNGYYHSKDINKYSDLDKFIIKEVGVVDAKNILVEDLDGDKAKEYYFKSFKDNRITQYFDHNHQNTLRLPNSKSYDDFELSNSHKYGLHSKNHITKIVPYNSVNTEKDTYFGFKNKNTNLLERYIRSNQNIINDISKHVTYDVFGDIPDYMVDKLDKMKYSIELTIYPTLVKDNTEKETVTKSMHYNDTDKYDLYD